MSKTHEKYSRLYVDGYHLSAHVLTVGPLVAEHEAEAQACLNDAVKAVKAIGHYMPSLGAINGLFDNTATTGLHTLHSAAGGGHDVTYAIGFGAVPAAGDPIFCGRWLQVDYIPAPAVGGGALPAVLNFNNSAYDFENGAYPQSWGRLLHPSGAETAVNSGTANHDHGAQTTAGGFGILHVLAGNGTATFTIEHSDTNADANFDAGGAVVTFDTTDVSSPFSEIKAIATGTTVERYLRWQIALGTATTVTFVMGFVRGR